MAKMTDIPGTQDYSSGVKKVLILGKDGSNMASAGNPLPIDGGWEKFTDIEDLVENQDLTNNYEDFGDVIDMRGYTKLGVWIEAITNDSEDVTLQILGKVSEVAVDGYNVIGYSPITIWAGSATDFNAYYEVDVSSIPYVQLQIKADVEGVTPGKLTIKINKVWR